MKTYPIQNEEDIHEILLNNKNDFNNVFELNVKNVQPWSKKISKPGMDLAVFEAKITPLIKQISCDSEITLIRKNSKMYIVSFLNIINKKGEYFSSVIDDLSENDRIIIMNGVVLKNFTKFNPNKLTVLVRPQDNSSVILFKHQNSVLEKSNLLIQKNLSLITDSGVNSLYGTIKKIIKYVDADLMLLRLQCCDKSCIKTHKYSHSESEYKNIVNEEKITGVKYDFYSNKVDIIVENPSNDFTSLALNQQIHLNNIKVKNVIGTNIYSLTVLGKIQNLKADPIDIGIVSPHRSPKKRFIIPTDLRPVNRIKLNHISNDIQLVSIATSVESSTTISPSGTSPSFQQSKFNETNLFDPLSDDDVNLSPCKDFGTSTQIVHKENVSSGSFGKRKFNAISCNSSSSKNINPKQKCYDNLSLGSPKKDTCLYKQREISSQKEISLCSSSDESLSPSFFKTQSELLISNQKTPSNNLNCNIPNETIKCIGPCRLVYTEPNIFTSSDIISGYCIKCSAFVQKCYLKLSNRNYKCPKCSNIVPVTFYFKMTFLYGKNESRAIEVCCYYKEAEYVIKKILKKKINVGQYLSNPDDRTLVMNSMKSLINNKTKVNIIFRPSPGDNINIIQGIDTKYIVTTTSTQ